MNQETLALKANQPVAAASAESTGARPVVKVIRGQPTSDGAGVKLTRVIGAAELPELDPFLLLDAFHSADPKAYIAGFPDHPHRGFETITYMLAGRMRHRDNKGHSGLLDAGGVQWMTAGRGIVHSEMPEQRDGLMSGFQLWLNLPASEKMADARYQDIPAASIPVVVAGGVTVKVIAGAIDGERGPVDPAATVPVYLDVALPAGTSFATTLPPGHAAVAFVFEGAADVGPSAAPTRVEAGQLGVLGEGGAFAARASGQGARLLLLAARPLGEPIARYGPFVMNSEGEIREAIADYQSGKF
ncbi:MAG: pirin family protein [Betaproteobacteria bacterium]